MTKERLEMPAHKRYGRRWFEASLPDLSQLINVMLFNSSLERRWRSLVSHKFRDLLFSTPVSLSSTRAQAYCGG